MNFVYQHLAAVHVKDISSSSTAKVRLRFIYNSINISRNLLLIESSLSGPKCIGKAFRPTIRHFAEVREELLEPRGNGVKESIMGNGIGKTRGFLDPSHRYAVSIFSVVCWSDRTATSNQFPDFQKL
jgi:hypothetical protein